MKKETVLITGGAGFIGSQVHALLRRSSYKAIVLDNLSRSEIQESLREDFFQLDVGDKNGLRDLFSSNEIDAVMHLAASIDVGESISKPDLYYQNNVVNTLGLLDVMLEFDVKNLIFSSSAAIFGIPNTSTLSEEHVHLPINPYGQTKLMVEHILADYGRAYGLKHFSFRYFNAAGGDPEGRVKNRKQGHHNLIPLVLESLNRGDGQVTIYGNDYPTPDGTCIRDFIHVHDIANAHILGMEQLFKGSQSQAYNLGNGAGFSVLQVIESVRRVSGQDIEILMGPRRPGDPPVLVANANKARRELHWEPHYPGLDVMIKHAWESVRNAPCNRQ